MKSRVSCLITAAASLMLVVVTAGSARSADVHQQYGQEREQPKDKSKQNAPSDAEQKAVAKIEAAPDVTAKLQAASEFIKKYPKSSLRAKVVTYVALEINKVEDKAQRATQLEGTLTVFKEPGDAEVINPILVDAYVKAGRYDDVFRVASAYLAKNPNDIVVLTQTSIEGIKQAQAKNTKFVPQSQQYATKAIELIESGKKPGTFDETKWNEYKSVWLPTLYRSLAMLSFMTGNKADARAKVDKALSINSRDALSHALLGYMLNDEYQQLAEQHKALTPGPLKDSLLKQALAKMDEMVEMLAQAVALSEGDESNKPLHDRLLEDLKLYYNYRHPGSADGLQQLIDKYKKQ